MKHIKLLTTLVSTTVIAGMLPAIITSCHSDNRSIFIDNTNKTKTFNLYQEAQLLTTEQTFSDFKVNNIASDIEITAEVKNASKFAGTITVKEVIREQDNLSLNIEFTSAVDPLIGQDASFDIVFTTTTGFSQTISGFNVHFTGSIFTVHTTTSSIYFEEKVYADAATTDVDVVLKTNFIGYKNGVEDPDLDQYYVVPTQTYTDITPTVVPGNNGMFYVNLHISNFTPKSRFAYNFVIKNRQSPSFQSSDTYTAYLTYTNDELDKFNYVNVTGGCRITGCCIADETTIVIPEQINGLNVTHIDVGAFDYQARVESITFPSTLNTIVTYSSKVSGMFKGCYKLNEVKVDPTNTTFTSTNLDGSQEYNCIMKKETDTEPKELLYGCGATEIPETITTIGQAAFYECLNVQLMSIPASVTTIESSAFRRCFNLNKVTINGNISEIKDNVFYDCKSLTNVDVKTSGSITKLGSNAFYNCVSLEEIYIPASLTSIEKDTFAYCGNVSKITVDTHNTKFASLIDFEECNGIFSRDGKTLYHGCKNTTIPTPVETIDPWAFYGCTGLENITFPDTLKTIETKAFYECSNLQKIVIPESVTSIGVYAFANCYKLESAEVKANMTSLPGYMFASCYLLEDLVLPQTLTTISNNTCVNCYSLLSVTIPKSVTKIANLAFFNSNFESVIFEDPKNWIWNGISPESVPEDQLKDPATAASLINDELPFWYSLDKKTSN